MPNTLKATILIAVFSIFSKILGAVRQAVFAHEFGAGEVIDIYVASFRIPDLLFNLLIIGTLSSAFIPIFVSYLKSKESEAFAIASSIFNLTLLGMAAFSLLGFVFAGVLTKLIVPGFSAEAQALTAEMTRILMLSPLLFSVSTVLTSVLHSHKRFLLAAIAPLLYNIAIIGGVVFLYPKMGLTGIAWGVVIGAALHFLIQLPSVLRLGLNPFRTVRFKHKAMKRFARLFIPRIFGIDLGQVSLLIASIVGSTLATGSLAIFYFADDLRTVPLGIFAIPFAVASFPVMAEFFAKKDYDGFKVFFSKTVVQILFLIIPISVLILLLRAQTVRLVLGIGEGTQFDFSATRQTALALGFFMLSLFSQSLVPILSRSFYALQNTVIPVLTAIASAVLNIALALVLVKSLGAAGMALAFSVASIFNMLVLFVLLHYRLGDLRDKFIILRVIKICIASVAMAVLAFVTLYGVAPLVDMRTYLGIFIQAVSATTVAVFGYLLVGKVIGLTEAEGIIKIGNIWFKKFTKPVTSTIVSIFTDLR